MSLKKKRAIKTWIFSLKEAMRINPDFVILVEGKNDKRSLCFFGIDSNRIYTLSGRSFYDLAEDFEKINKIIILLMDFDKKGEYILRKLKKIFDIYKIEYDTSFRENLKKYKVKYIEKLSEIYIEEMLREKIKSETRQI
jgi:5S rRNA maturation endonuclease (ribonuclease M5)